MKTKIGCPQIKTRGTLSIWRWKTSLYLEIIGIIFMQDAEYYRHCFLWQICPAFGGNFLSIGTKEDDCGLQQEYLFLLRYQTCNVMQQNRTYSRMRWNVDWFICTTRNVQSIRCCAEIFEERPFFHRWIRWGRLFLLDEEPRSKSDNLSSDDEEDTCANHRHITKKEICKKDKVSESKQSKSTKEKPDNTTEDLTQHLEHLTILMQTIHKQQLGMKPAQLYMCICNKHVHVTCVDKTNHMEWRIAQRQLCLWHLEQSQ